MTTKAERMTHWRLSRQLFKPEEESGAHATSAMQLRSPPPTTSLASLARSPCAPSVSAFGETDTACGLGLSQDLALRRLCLPFAFSLSSSPTFTFRAQ